MSDINTVKAQIQSLIDLANTTTGNQDTNLTDGVNALVSGYGKGGSSNVFGVKLGNANTSLYQVQPILSVTIEENRIVENNLYHGSVTVETVAE